MKKILLGLLSISCLFSFRVSNAQSFTLASDTLSSTLHATIISTGSVEDAIRNNTGSNLLIKWRVTGTDFPADWLAENAFGICDNSTCKQNIGGQLWNTTTGSGSFFTSAAYASDTVGDFHLQLDLTYATPGTHSVTISFTDATSGGLGATSKSTTFVINRAPTGVVSVTSATSDVALYPNPAKDELNVVYDPGADVKSIAVYNIIGKVLTVYKVTDSRSANLNIENIPSGIYFVRLMNSNGAMVATRKFTKQ